MTQPPIKLTANEMAILTMMRRNTFQSISVQIQDGVITAVDQTLKFRRKKGGKLVAGVVNRAAIAKQSAISPEELAVIKMLREKPYQKIEFNIQDGAIEGVEQTLKFRKLKPCKYN